MRIVLLIVLLGLSACDHSEDLATCKGPVFALNAGRWQPQPVDLKTPARIGNAE